MNAREIEHYRAEDANYDRYLRSLGRKQVYAELITYCRDGVEITKEQAEEGFKNGNNKNRKGITMSKVVLFILTLSLPFLCGCARALGNMAAGDQTNVDYPTWPPR